MSVELWWVILVELWSFILLKLFWVLLVESCLCIYIKDSLKQGHDRRGVAVA